MKENETLFYLVRSLTKNEKRNFILGAKQGREKAGKGYLALYRWYEKQEHPANPTRGELKRLGLTANRLAVQKHYLVHRILESLMEHSTTLSEEAKVRLLINKSELLLAKGMVNASLRMLDAAERLATACFSYQLQLDILLRREAHVVKYEDVKRVRQLETKKKQLLATIGNINDYQQLSYAVFELTRAPGFTNNTQQRKALDRLWSGRLLQHERLAFSPIAKFHMYHTLCHYASLVQDPELSLKYGFRHLAIFDEEPEATRHELDYYITLLFNISMVTIYFGTTAEIRRLMRRWEELPQQFGSAMTPQRQTKWQLYNMEMTVRNHLFAGRFAEVARLAPKIAQLGGVPHPYAPVFREGISFYVAYALHAAGNSRQALRWLTPLITEEKGDYRRYRLLVKAFLLRILIHSDLGRPEVTEALCGQLEHFLTRHGQGAESDPERVALAAFGHLPHVETGKMRQDRMRQAATDLLAVLCRPGGWFVAYEHLYLYAWFRAHASRRTLQEVMPEALETFRRKARQSFRR